MKYRAEIDGLRALAIIPVVLFHAGFEIFSGGYIGVDIFFVISGYLITSIIFSGLNKNTFSIFEFYDRRARRILPALFIIMLASSIMGYFFMMPDEYKNFGQSLVATSLFSNNILLAITSGYWDLATEFKPLMHTWSLGVEDQYYIIFPILMIFLWKNYRKNFRFILTCILIISLIIANWGVNYYPNEIFYALPARAWEILLGASIALNWEIIKPNSENKIKNQFFSLLGIFLIFFSILFFTKETPSPSLYTLIPTIGTILIIVYATRETLVNRFLSGKIMVGIGLVSYSFYLWHQPLLAFSRIYFSSQPSNIVNLGILFLSLFLAYFTWIFIEKPCRSSSFFSKKYFIVCSVTISLCFIYFGYYLNKTYGMAYRVFDSSIKIQDMDKRNYNEKVFQFKKDSFLPGKNLKVLVVGNSFGRDFINMTQENFNMEGIDLVYRDDLFECIYPYRNSASKKLFSDAEIIVFSNGSYRLDCIENDINFSKERKKKLYYIGTKNFGYNLNWIIRLDDVKRNNQYNPIPSEILALEENMSYHIPPENYISFLAPFINKKMIPITDKLGRMLSTDRAHLTKYGAIFFGNEILLNSDYGNQLQGKQ